ncbi:protein Lines homolog 1 [Morone saxatilis]|uniref:protein Lines homolog 1 n=1 Tax=Morone saxatilis TaxID=34816 RepID=UPI0015E1BDF4|nr:protein Lines homolog 1 [Morone saxatilis]
MERAAGYRQRFDCLTDAYRCLVTGSCPSGGAADVAGVIFSGVCAQVPGEEDRGGAPAARCRELSCISVSLLERISCSLADRSLPPAVELYCVEVLRGLFQDMDLMSKLVHQFQSEDQIVSHLAAKSVSAWVFYQLLKSGALSPVWEQKCVQAFHSSPPGTELDACLWSLTEVLKRLLKGAHQEIIGKLLAAFDSSLTALCKFLPEEGEEMAQCLVDFTRSRHSGTTFCLLLDLLEVLTASSLLCGAGVCLKSQRMTHIHSSALLTAISSSSEYYVKKRALLLLKRAVLQKAGEDWALGEVPLTGPKYEHFHFDMSMLAQSVLTAVAANWLQSVQVESTSFFGGTRRGQGDEGQKPDCVMLRAVSLLLLKSIELHIQTAGGTAGVGSPAEVYGYLQSLWGFLKRNSGQLMEVTHLCCWVSLLFGEQDDDMMEAAKALLSVFLHHRVCSGLDDFAVLEAACASGCNPHCHFLLLLQSISFDHSILLDFLISTETCFLEYFVRYLKCLRADWRGFTAACGRICVSDCHLSLTSSRGIDLFATTYKGGSERVWFKPTGVISPVGSISGLRLVEYGSSDESDPETMDSQDEAGTSVCEKSRSGALDVKQEISGPPVPIRQKHYEPSHSTGLLHEDRGPEGSSPLVLHNEQALCLNTPPPSGQVNCETSARAVLCLSELREVVTRLQTKKLFPYNPSSLLKLLAQIQQSHLSQFYE